MAIKDYNKRKFLDVTSVSGTPQFGKAQPVIIKDKGEAYSLADASYTGTSISIQDRLPQGLAFNNDGTKLFEIGSGSDLIYEYNLSTAYDISTASYTGTSISTQDGGPEGLVFNGDGSKLFEIGSDSDLIYEYNLSTAYDISTASYTGTSISTQDSVPTGLAFNNDGTKLFEIGDSSNLIYEYNISTADDSKTGTGDIVIDDSNVSGPSDIAFYDQNGTLLPYELENPGVITSNGLTGELVAWVWNDWVRDGTTQAQVVYGDGPTSSEENVTGTWNNTGQNAEVVWHLNETSGSAIDSTSNNHDSTSTTGTNYNVNGAFDGGRGFDGTDDRVIFAQIFPTGPGYSGKVWFRSDTSDDGGGENHYVLHLEDNQRVLVDAGQVISGNIGVFYDGSFRDTGVAVDTNNPQLITFYDDGTDFKVFVDGTEQISVTSNPVVGGSDNAIGNNGTSGGSAYDGMIDELGLFSDADDIDAAWSQAEYDASPKAGQVFFSQQAAESTTTAVTATVSDSLVFNENTASIISFTASDSIGFSENQQTTLADILSDNIQFTENTKSQLIDTLADNLQFSENEAGQLIDTLTDSITFTENLNATLALTVTTTDSLTFGENIDSQISDTLSQQLGFTENVQGKLIDSIAEQLGFTEQTQIATTKTLTDQLNFTEETATAIATRATDNLTFAENIETQLKDTLIDNLQLTEQTATAVAANVSDNLTFSEQLSAIFSETLKDELEFTEETAGKLIDTFSESLSFQDQVVFASLLTINAPSKAIITNKNRFAVMENHTFTEGDLADELSATLEDEDGAIDLSQAKRVELDVKDRQGNAKFNNKTISIDDAANGKVTYNWDSGDFIEDEPGVYRAKFRIIDNNDEPESVPNDGFITLEIEEEIE